MKRSLLSQGIFIIISLLVTQFGYSQFSETFDNTTIPANWTNSNSTSSTSTNAFWKFTGNPGYAMGGTQDHTGNNGSFAWVDGSSPDGLVVSLTSPSIQPIPNMYLDFYLKRDIGTYSTTHNTFTVDFYDGSTWHNGVFTHSSNTAGGNWELFTVQLDNFPVNGNIQIRFNVNKNGSTAFYDDVALDDVSLYIGYPPTPNDAGITGIDTSTVTCKGLNDVKAQLSNFGSDQLTSATVNWSVDGVVQSPLLFSGVLDTLGGQGSTDTTLTLGQYNFPSSGTYNIKVWSEDPNGVFDTINFNDTVTSEVDADMIDLQVEDMADVSCFGGSDGYVKVTSNGYAPTYIWSSGSTGDSVTNLWSETHSVVATDSVSCPDTLDVIVNEPPELMVNLLEGGSVPCYGDNQGMVSVEGQGGVGNYTYYWGNGDTDSTRSGLNVNTTHNITVTDGNGCQATASYTIFEPNELEVLTDSYNKNAGCENQIGAISVSANGGTSPFSYNWSNGSTSSGLNGLSGGDYTVTITDDNGCTVTETYPVYDLDVSITNLTPTLIANLSGATYQWIDCDNGQPVDGATSDTFTPEDNGSYAVVITSGNCTDTSRCVEVLNTSTEDLIGGENSFKIYPNPTSGEFTMSFGSSAKNVEYELINAQGSVIDR
ncbi:MAG: hypothetical protein RI557_07020, partial [Salibacter sp.]|nr:hypothetical protein [Salibacter sp.]